MTRKSLAVKLLFPLAFAFCMTSCSKDCDPPIATCSEAPPTNELCAAIFNRWFYDAGNDECEQIAYSGCSQKGFATQQECETCKCD